MKKLLFAISLLGAGALTATTIAAQDAPQVPGAVDPGRVQAGSYTIDAAHTQVGWRVSHFGFNDYLGIFGQITGTMQLDPAAIEDAKFDVTIPVSSVVVSSDGLRDHLFRPGKDGAAPDFFGPDPKPARFVSTSVRKTGETTAVVSGMLTMNGKSGPVTMLVNFTGAGTNPFHKKETVGFEARAVIDRTQWGVNYAVPLVEKDVELNISAAFERD